MKIETNKQDNSTTSTSGKNQVQLKICGMKYPDNILEVAALLPEYMGFIFWEKSARYFEGPMSELPKSIKKVGVFVNEKSNIILDKVAQYDLQAVQLHGQESVAFCLDLKSKLGTSVEIIKVFSADETFDFSQLKPYEPVCDFFLFDTKGKLPGGNGTTFDWKILQKYPSSKPFFLSGGIGIDEIAAVNEILNTHLPLYAIDVNSKFEIEPGLKNLERLKNLKIEIIDVFKIHHLK